MKGNNKKKQVLSYNEKLDFYLLRLRVENFGEVMLIEAPTRAEEATSA